MPRRLKRLGAVAHRRRRQRIEELESRWLLNATAVAPGPPAAIWAEASLPVNFFAAGHAAIDQPNGYTALRAIAVPGPFAGGQPMTHFEAPTPRESARLAAFAELAAAAESPAEFVFVAVSSSHSSDDVFAPKPLGQLPDGWQHVDFGAFAALDGGFFDSHSRLVELLRAPPDDVRLAMSSLGGLRSSNGALAYFDPSADVERHATAGVALLFGQSAEGEEAAIGGRPMGGTLPMGSLTDADGTEQAASTQRGEVGFLAAFEEALREAGAGESAAAMNAARLGAQRLAASLVRDVITPRMAFDAAALTVAINDLAAQADELSEGLLELLSPAASDEAALVAAAIGAGVFYRQWRALRRNGQTEEKDMLLSRFIRGHASIRIGGDAP